MQLFTGDKNITQFFSRSLGAQLCLTAATSRCSNSDKSSFSSLRFGLHDKTVDISTSLKNQYVQKKGEAFLIDLQRRSSIESKFGLLGHHCTVHYGQRPLQIHKLLWQFFFLTPFGLHCR